jgi:protein-tyrosine phosphatase
LSRPQTQSVLFVCLGNICRSPTGEGVLQHLADQRNLTDQILIDSAGTIDYHTGKGADPRMQAAANERGINLLSRSRQIKFSDLETFDLVIAMDRENLAEIQTLHPAPTATIRLLSSYLDHSWPQDVPDPYYGGAAGFEYVLDMIQTAAPKILDELFIQK